jgi:hypothetical protein
MFVTLALAVVVALLVSLLVLHRRCARANRNQARLIEIEARWLALRRAILEEDEATQARIHQGAAVARGYLSEREP